ncbi:hypothetical protein PWT90_00047 [Aphanocladium album]|nr:hypothetical protein PWT90_00047 [Aphanocladium album]
MYNEPKIDGRQQDLSLGVAAELAGINAQEGFYEHIYKPRDHQFLSGENRTRRSKLKSEALRQLENVAFANTFQACDGRQKRKIMSFADRKKLGDYPGLYRYLVVPDKAGDTEDGVGADSEVHVELTGLDEQLPLSQAPRNLTVSKKSDERRYEVHRLKLGCGSEICQKKNPKPGFAVPVDNGIPWALPKASVLERPPQAASWANTLLRQREAKSGLLGVDDIICRTRRDPASIQQDMDPRWIIETPPRYVIRKPQCNICARRNITWCAVDRSIEWLDPASISKTWAKKEKNNWNIDDMVNNPHVFSKTEEQRIWG